MPDIQPLNAVCYAGAFDSAMQATGRIAPPYDVLDESSKQALLTTDPCNIVKIDLPFTPPKVVGPDAVYEQAGRTYRQWLDQSVLVQRVKPAVYVYEQAYTHRGRSFARRGVIARVRLQDFGPSPDGQGGVFAHEQTFPSGKEDRLKLMRACKAQLSPVFGIYRDPQQQVVRQLEPIASGSPAGLSAQTSHDGVTHRVWEVTNPQQIQALTRELAKADIFIADGHHRYHTALNYRNEVAAANGGKLPADHPANFGLFVLVAMEDPGMIVLPTHRVLGGMENFSLQTLIQSAQGKLKITPFPGHDLDALEQALPQAGPHAVGLYVPSNPSAPLAIATTTQPDPLAQTHSQHDQAWRQLDVAIVQHLIVEQICQPKFCPAGQAIKWKYPHQLSQLQTDTQSAGFQLGLILQPTPLQAVMAVSGAGELMPQKSTFFYPKLATGLIINPLA